MEFNEQELLTHAGKVKASVAREIAEERYDQFDTKRRHYEAIKADEDDIRELREFERVYSVKMRG